jgi:hypothetical protein
MRAHTRHAAAAVAVLLSFRHLAAAREGAKDEGRIAPPGMKAAGIAFGRFVIVHGAASGNAPQRLRLMPLRPPAPGCSESTGV